MHDNQLLYGRDLTALDTKQTFDIGRNNAAIIKKNELLEKPNEDTTQKFAIQSTEKNTPLIEVVCEKSHIIVTPVDTGLANSSDTKSIEKNSSIIFNCENLESLKFLNIEDDDMHKNVICSDSEVESARCISHHAQ